MLPSESGAQTGVTSLNLRVSKGPYGSAFVAAARKLDGIGSNLNLPARRKRRIHKAQGLHRPEADNLVGIYAALADIDPASVLKQFANAQFSTFKAALTDLAVSKLGPIGAEMKRLLADPAAIDAVLADGAARAEKMARETMNAVKDVVGFVRSLMVRCECRKASPPLSHP